MKDKTKTYVNEYFLPIMNSAVFVFLACGIIVVAVYFSKEYTKNNVCNNYLDYLFIGSSPNCWYDPDVTAEVPEIVLRRNLSLETYNTVTEDGYILTTFRIPQQNSSKGAILLEHGIIGTAEIWLDKGTSSYAFALHEAGYDIWLGNLRGTKYSNTHIKLKNSEYDYWDWSFHEYGYYDMKAQVDLIKTVTNRNDIIFVGYSVSATASVIYASLRPDEAKNSVKVFINLGLSPYYKHARGLFPFMSTRILHEPLKAVNEFFRFGSPSHGDILRTISRTICLSHPLKYLCVFLSLSMAGFESDFDPKLVTGTFSKLPDGTSWKTVYHLTQNLHLEKLQFYEYEREVNLMKYKSEIAPEYPLHRINVPFYTIYGTGDFVAHPKDVEEFMSRLPPIARHGIYAIEGYNHFDYLYGKQANRLVISHIIDFLEIMS